MGTNAKFRDLAIRTIIGEAGNQPPEGQIAVAHVIKNRADSGAWGDASQGGAGRVILAPKQFSLWNQGDKAGDMARSISADSPIYQRVGAIVDGVFNGQTPDPTGGATHYYNPSVASPAWGNGPGQMIGAHKFMKLALNAGNTAGTAVVSPSTVGQGASTPAAPPLAAAPDAAKPAMASAITSALASAKSMLGKNEVPDHDEIMSYLHDGGQDLDPHKSAWCAAFVSASLQKAGLPVPTQVVKDSAFGAGALAGSYKTYGSGVDAADTQAGDILVANDGSHVGFAEGPVRQGANGPEVQMIAGNEKDTSGQYTPGSYTNPTTGAVANRAQVGMVGERWVPLSQYSVRRYTPTNDAAGPASSAAPAAAATAAVPATQAQPVAAIAPPGASPIPGPAANSSAGFVGPGSDKVSLVQSMTTGTSHNPQITTAANWGNLFGGGAPLAPPAAAPAATTAPPPQPASAPKPLDTSYGPQLPPPTVPSGAPPASAAPGSPLSSIVSNWGATTPNNLDAMPDTGRVPGSGVTGRSAMTEGAPSMGFPAMTNPFGQAPTTQSPARTPSDMGFTAPPSWPMTTQSPPQQVSQLPGSMFASAQNLIKYLFPTATG